MEIESSLCGIQIEQADFDWLSEYTMRQEADVRGATSPSPQSPPTATPSPTYGCAVAHASFNKYTMQDPDVVNRPRKAEWTQREDVVILATFRKLGTQWHRIAALLPGRTPDGVRNRWHRLQRQYKLRESVHGRRALDVLLHSCGIADCWMPPIVLDVGALTEDDEPCIKGADHGRTKWTPEEDAVIHDGVRRLGTKWRQIVSSLEGRSDSSIRNRWRRLNGKDARSTSASGATEEEEEPRSPCPPSPNLKQLQSALAPVTPPPSRRLSSIKRKRSNSVDWTPETAAGPDAQNYQTATPEAMAGPYAPKYQPKATEAYVHHYQTAAPEAEAGPYAPQYQTTLEAEAGYASDYQTAVHHAPHQLQQEPAPIDFDLCSFVEGGVLASEIFPAMADIARGSFDTVDSDRHNPVPVHTPLCDEDAKYLSHNTGSAFASEPTSRRLISGMSSASASTAMSEAEDEEDEWGGRKKFRTTWSAEEDGFISRCVEEPGELWSKIAEHTEGRSHRAVRNRWPRIHNLRALYMARGQENGDRSREPKLEHISVTSPVPHCAGLPCSQISDIKIEPYSLVFSSVVPHSFFSATD